jgi:hypothetical protein
MGLFDRVGDLLGGDADPTGDPPGGDADPDAPPRDHRSRQRHGSHWTAVAADREAAIRRLLTRAVEEGDPVEGRPVDGATVTGYRHAEGPLGVLAVTVDGDLRTGYPVGAGAEHDLTVTDCQPWETGVEAWLSGTVGDAETELSLFETNYYVAGPAEPDTVRSVSLAGFPYAVAPAEGETLVQRDDAEFEFSVDTEVAGFTPWAAGAVDDYVVRTVPTAVERFTFAGQAVSRVEAPLARVDGDGLDCVFYLGDHLGPEEAGVDAVPSVGEPFQAAVWLQGRVR